MPVLVTGAETGLGREAVRALARAGGELRLWLDEDALDDPEGEAQRLRRDGRKAAIGTIDDEGRLEQALTRVHTVVHCWGGPLVAPDEELDGVAGVLSAALGAGCRRFVWASHLGAGDPGDDPYLRACAEAEDLLAGADLETVVFRRALTYGPGDELTLRLAGPAGDALRQDARHAPLLAADLATAMRRADDLDRAATRTDLSLVLELAGPEVVTTAELLRALRGAVAPDPTPLPPSTAALYDRDLVPGPGALGREGTPLPRGLAHTPGAP